jgi:2-polyprenyl-6-methoxyphenol hydroxylase-like FAD-dependent oxidoreductase
MTIDTRCCIAGGGPAGMMLGVLLARAGVPVVVLEKHGDFLRDFRGDTVHPSTLEVIHELGVLDAFLARPHSELREVRGMIGNERVTLADFSHLPVQAPFIAMVPQWEFLDFLADLGRNYETFQLLMRAEVFALIERDGRVAGVRAQTPQGPIDIHAGLVVGADGRASTVRSLGRLPIKEIGAPIDVLWMRLSKHPEDAATAALGNVRNGHVFVMLDRGDYWQCAYVIRKGGYDELRRTGLDAFRAEIVSVVPFLSDRVGEIRSWDDVKLLTVKIDRLRQWHRPGLLCIGDAAHAMSPVGGVGINLAIQDAVAAANILAEPLRRGTPSAADLQAVQRRREFPARVTQRAQVFIQERILFRTLKGGVSPKLPLLARLLNRFPVLRRIPARLVGLGVRPEHVRTAPVETTKTENHEGGEGHEV